MYLTRELVRGWEGRYGRAEEKASAAEFAPREFALLEHCLGKNRAHDVTLFIRGGDGRFALIRKPSYPPEVFRPPSGGIEPRETLEEGAVREALEETGLSVCLERYLLRVEARFTCRGARADWSTHVFLARTGDLVLNPTDRKEIEDCRWSTVRELQEVYRPRMLAMGSEGMRYRADLQDTALELMGLGDR